MPASEHYPRHVNALATVASLTWLAFFLSVRIGDHWGWDSPVLLAGAVVMSAVAIWALARSCVATTASPTGRSAARARPRIDHAVACHPVPAYAHRCPVVAVVEGGRDVRIILRRFGVVVLLLLVPFAIAALLGGSEQVPDLPGGVVLAAAVVIALLTADVVLPVPSSAVLIAAGAALGPISGAAAGTLGLVAGAIVAYVLGARFGREPSGRDAERARRLFERWGPAAVVVTRPVPLLAESTAVVAGTARMDLRRFLTAVVVGAVPTCLGLALAGHAGADSLDGTGLAVVLVVTATLAAVISLLAHRRVAIGR